MTNKFKVGDKVVTVEDLSGFGFPKGEVAEVVNVYAHGTTRIRNKSGYEETFADYRLQLADTKPTKNQRITTLEKTVAKQGEEIEELKLIVAQIRKPSTVVEEALANDIIEFEGKQYKKVDREAEIGDVVVINKNDGNLGEWWTVGKPYLVHGESEKYIYLIADDEDDLQVYSGVNGRTPETVDVYELIVEDKQEILPPAIKTRNELRAEIIEKAKAFVDENGGDDYHFEVNQETRTVFTWKINRVEDGYDAQTGLAVCPADKVYNEYIERAIAFGRAEELDVSEFEQAAQPSHYAVGQIVQRHEEPINTEYKYRVDEIGNGTTLTKLFESGKAFSNTTRPLNFESEFARSLKVYEDTNAQYGGVE